MVKFSSPSRLALNFVICKLLTQILFRKYFNEVFSDHFLQIFFLNYLFEKMQLVIFVIFLQICKLTFQIIFVLDYFDQNLQIAHLDYLQIVSQ